MSDILKKYSEEIYRCIRCGACRSVCPTFSEALSETAVARGRMALAEAVADGRLKLTDAYEKVIFGCALCGACKAGCPSGVDVPAIVEAAREELAKTRGSEPLARYLARKSLKDKKAMDTAFALMALGSSAYGPLASTPLIKKYMPFAKGDKRRRLPKIPARPFSKRVPELTRAEEPKGTVAFYAGCAVGYVYPQIGESAVRVLSAAGYDVRVLKDELCCGKPLKSLGESAAAADLALRNVEAFGRMDADFVVMACPTCALTFREQFPKILPEPEAADARALAGKVEDINSFLVNRTDIIKRLDASGLVVTYHDPCHLNLGMGISSEPRELVKAATGGIAEMAEPGSCCGFGGAFSFINYELSSGIAAKKADRITRTGADAVATACPGCIMHIQDALMQSGSKMAALHTIQLIDRALVKK